MKSVLNELIKVAIALVLGLVFMWFLLSLSWSRDEMSVAERVVGVVYMMLAVPCYYGIKKVLGLR